MLMVTQAQLLQTAIMRNKEHRLQWSYGSANVRGDELDDIHYASGITADYSTS